MMSATTDHLPPAPWNPADLQVGDILLMMGHGPISALIAWCGDSIYSHAALVADNGDLIEAAAKGVRRYALAQRLADAANYYYIDAFRPLGADGQALNDDDRAAVLAHALSLLGVPYPLDSLATLGVILAIRGKWPQHWLARLAVREAMDHLIRNNPSHMVCSEVVYRSFAECAAQPPGRLAPEIVLEPRGDAPFPHIDLKELWDEIWPLLHPSRQQALMGLVPQRLQALQDMPMPSAQMLSDLEDAALDRQAAQVREAIGVDVNVHLPLMSDHERLADSTPPTPIPHPNPKLVTPLDLASSPSNAILGRVMNTLIESPSV
jgi:hypothetical protein